MNLSDLPTPTAPPDWLSFSGILLIICPVIAVATVAFFLFRKFYPAKIRKRKRKRRLNPTRAEIGGLPPTREPGEPPAGL